jgi:hypothetical protein
MLKNQKMNNSFKENFHREIGSINSPPLFEMSAFILGQLLIEPFTLEWHQQFRSVLDEK